MGKDFNKIIFFFCFSDDYYRVEDKIECSGSDDFEEVVIKKVKILF